MSRATRCLLPAMLLTAGSLAYPEQPAIESHPLEPRSGPRGATMFAEMSPEATGVRTTNNYADPEMWSGRYHEFEIGAIGTGVAIADYDGDGRPDIFIVSKTESCRLFRNLGGWRFEDVTERAGVGDTGAAAMIWKQGAAFADVNSDGWPDLYVCRNGAPNLLYINRGDGTFHEEAAAHGLAVSDASSMAAFCDYDCDGWLDLYLQTNLLDNASRPGGQPDRLFHNNGDGTFTDVSGHAGISQHDTQGNSATWWDYNNDGWPDLYVANDFQPGDDLYRNNGDGTFTNVIAGTVPHTPYSAMGSDIGDINNDGRVDLMVADMAATSHEKDERTMAGSRATARDPEPGDNSAPAVPWNSVYLNSGTPRVFEAAQLLGLAASDWTWSLRFEDLDNDGRVDLHVTNGMHREIHNLDLIRRMLSAESAAERIRIGRSSPVLEEHNLAFRNAGDLRFESVGPRWGLDQLGVSFGAAFADLDGDGDLDLVFTNYERGATVLRNDSDTGHSILVDLRGTTSNRFGVGATVRIETTGGSQVRQLVLARGYLSTSEPVVHFGLGDDTIVHSLTVEWPSGTKQAFENLAADARYTIHEAEGASNPGVAPPPTRTIFTEETDKAHAGVRSREEDFDEFARQSLLPMRMNRRGPSIAVGDFNGDLVDDFAVGGTTLDPLRTFTGTPTGPFRELNSGQPTDPWVVDDGPILIFDANGDTRVDMLVTRGGNALPPAAAELQPRLLLGGASALVDAPEGTLPPIHASIGAAAAADFDGDGRLDLFLGGRVQTTDYPQPPQSFLLLNRDDKFEDATSSVAPGLSRIGMVTSAVWSDINADGRPDLVVALEWGNIRAFINEGGTLVDATGSLGFNTAGTGWWTSLASSDFNGDGRPDFVAGNIGLNTIYRAPATLLVGDFRGDGTPGLIEATTGEGRLYPLRSRREIAAVIPAVGRKFPTNDRFASATVRDLIGDEKLDGAQRFVATELQNGVLLSTTGGRYEWHPLPRIAQMSTFQGVVAADFDGDGRTDILAAQNSYAPSPVTGRIDGGLGVLLLGDGHGGFAAVEPAKSGFIVPGDAKSLVLLSSDVQLKPDVLVARNDDTTMLFRNQPGPGRSWIVLTLLGKPGNPTGIGARATATSKDGATQTIEVACGSGWMSQSASKLFFGSPGSNPVNKIEIRWPDGAVSNIEPVTTSQIQVRHP